MINNKWAYRPFLALAVLSLIACGNSNQQAAEPVETAVVDTAAETERLNKWFEEKYEEELLMSPIGLTFLGRKERYGEIDDMSEAAEDEQLEWKRQTVEEMKSEFNYDALTDDAKLSYDLWAYQYEDAAADMEFRRNGYIFNQMQGVHTFFPTLLLSFHKVESLSDLEAFNSRLSGVARGMNQLVERAKLHAEGGVRPPRFSYDIVMKQAQDIISGKPFDDTEKVSSLWKGATEKVSALQEKGEIDEAQAEALLATAKTALLEEVKPAYEGLISFMQADIENTSEQPQGASLLAERRGLLQSPISLNNHYQHQCR